jgi:hypothetical protein
MDPTCPNIFDPFQAFAMQKLTMEANDGPAKGFLRIGGKSLLEILYVFPTLVDVG